MRDIFGAQVGLFYVLLHRRAGNLRRLLGGAAPRGAAAAARTPPAETISVLREGKKRS